jgi:uncharacterized protein
MDRQFDKGAAGTLPKAIIAARSGDEEALSTILEQNINVSAKDDQGQTALINAVRAGHARAAEVLARYGALEERDKHSYSALMWAAMNGDTECLNVLIAAGADLEAKTVYGATPLMLAARNGHMSIIGLLLSNGADFRRRADNGMNALEFARSEGHQEIAELLAGLESGSLGTI